MVEKSRQRGVPVIIIKNAEEHVIIGWNKETLDKVLGLGGHAVSHIKLKKKKSSRK